MTTQPPAFGAGEPAILVGLLKALKVIGHPMLVGGCVRDNLMGRPTLDFDVEVYGSTDDSVSEVVSRFGNPDPVGKSFGVYKIRGEGAEIDISLPRRETKTGSGHRGFGIEADPSLSPLEALARRDFTINAIAMDPFNGDLIDPYGGQEDIKARVLRHVGPAFVEDPLRVLRAFQFAGRLDFKLHSETASLCRSIARTFSELPVERIWGEWAKWAALSTRPSAGLRALDESGWLVHFPEIASLKGVNQDPEWHPEGDVLTHTCHCVDALAQMRDWRDLDTKERRLVMLATLAHDVGKPGVTARAEKNGVLRWISPGHDVAGGPISECFLKSIGAPVEFLEKIPRLIENHHSHHNGPNPPSATSVRRLSRRLSPATVSQWILLLRADHMGRPPLVSSETEERISAWEEVAKQLELNDAAPKPILLGRHLIEAGLTPGRGFKSILDAAFEAQLDGAFADETGARTWLAAHLGTRPA